MAEGDSTTPSEYHALALAKMSRILGPERAQQLVFELLGRLRLTLATADELLMFSTELSKLGGFEGAVGAMLSVRALMSGAGVKGGATVKASTASADEDG